MQIHLKDIQRYRNFIELKALDYAVMYDTLLDEHEASKGGTLTDNQLAVFTERFNYWNRKPVDILKDIISYYESIEIEQAEEALENILEDAEELALAI